MTPLRLQALKMRLLAAMRAWRASPFMMAVLSTLSVLAGAAGLYMASAFFPAGDPPKSVQSEWRPPGLSAFEPLAPKPAAADAQTLSRPLFAKSRRLSPVKASPAETERAPATAALSAPMFTVVGIARSGAKSRAFLAGSNGADGEWYGVGENISGWTVADIRRIDLTLKSGDRSADLKLYPDQPSPATAVPAPKLPLPPSPPPFIPDPKFRKRT